MDRIESIVSLVSPVDFSDLKAAKGFIQSLGKANGGRKGTHDTRGQNEAIGDAVNSRSDGEYQRTGGSLLKETRINTPGGGKTHRYMDNTFTNGSDTFHVQTVDANGLGQMTTREASAALDAAKASQQVVVCVSKQSCG